MTTATKQLIGNRWALVGAIVYLLEWVAIAGFHAGNTPTDPGMKPDAIVAMYSAHATGVALSAAWFSVVLQGRILFTIGVRDALRRSGADSLFADLAVAAMVASVILEIAAYAVTGAAARLALNGDRSAVVALDAAGNYLGLMIFAPLGVSILAAAAAQQRSGLFPKWIAWLGLASGVAGIGLGLALAPAFAAGPGPYDTVRALGFATLGFWVWMLATGILLFRHTPTRSDNAANVPAAAASDVTRRG